MCENTFSVIQTVDCNWAAGLWKTIPGTNNKIAIGANLGGDQPIGLDHAIFQYSSMLFFPDFVAQFTQVDFTTRMDIFLESMLPVHMETTVNTISGTQLNKLIPKFCNWRNNLRKVGATKEELLENELELEKTALELIALLIEIDDEVND